MQFNVEKRELRLSSTRYLCFRVVFAIKNSHMKKLSHLWEYQHFQTDKQKESKNPLLRDNLCLSFVLCSSYEYIIDICFVKLYYCFHSEFICFNSELPSFSLRYQLARISIFIQHLSSYLRLFEHFIYISLQPH